MKEYDHQVSPARNIKGNSIKEDPKSNIDQKFTESICRNKDFRSRITALNSYLSIVTLNVNGLNAPMKWHRISD